MSLENVTTFSRKDSIEIKFAKTKKAVTLIFLSFNMIDHMGLNRVMSLHTSYRFYNVERNQLLQFMLKF